MGFGVGIRSYDLMEIRFSLVWLVFGVALMISRLAAQDVTVTDPAWLDPAAPAADQLPTFKKRPKPDFPDELKQPEQVAYAIVFETLDEKGKRMSSARVFSNPYLEGVTGSAVSMDAIKYVPAKRGGDNVMVGCWFACIFNPASASLKKADATPRLLAVAPVVVGKRELPAGTKLPLVIWATLSIDEKGQLQNYVFDEPEHETLRPQVGGSLHFWRFAAARRGGQAVAAELKVPLILNQAYRPKMTDVQPRVISREPPVYPRAMKVTGLRGEVLLEFVVDKTGAVKDVVVAKTNNPGFNEAALAALMQWKFEPGRKAGEPVNARMQQPFVFDIEDGGQDYSSVQPASNKTKESLPEAYRYDLPPKPKALVIPVYPFVLFQEETEGDAKVAFLIDVKGRVTDVKVLAASHPAFGLALTAALEAYEFIPAQKNGKPCPSVLNTEQKFSKAEGMFSELDEDLIKLESKHPEKIFSAKKLDAPLNPTHQRSPVFPSAMRDRLNQGEAVIQILIDEEGKVHLPRIVKATDPAFGYAAMQAVVEWRFEPPKVGGKTAVVRVQVPFMFKQVLGGDQPKAKSAIDQSTLDSALPADK